MQVAHCAAPRSFWMTGARWAGAAVTEAGFGEFRDESEEQSAGDASGVVEFVDPKQELFVVGEVVTVLVEGGDGVVDSLCLTNPVVLARRVYLGSAVLGEATGLSAAIFDDDAGAAAERGSGASESEAGRSASRYQHTRSIAADDAARRQRSARRAHRLGAVAAGSASRDWSSAARDARD